MTHPSGDTADHGFTLVELMVVVLILGIIIAVAVPVFFAAEERAQQRACMANQRDVEGAYQTYVASTGYGGGAGSWASVVATLVPEYISREPQCPIGGTYTFDGSHADCSIVDHND